MSSPTRMYERLGQIPTDPDDPESLDDLIVCAFGAFERYYICWKNKAGEFRQDGYDLPPALLEWLWPADGTTRDFASLQVVFGRGDEYFASDKDGKLEFKEPEKKEPQPEEQVDSKPSSIRRTRTMSVFQSSADAARRIYSQDEVSASPTRRSAQHSPSRPPSGAFATRTLVDSPLNSYPNSRSSSISSSRSSGDSIFTSPPASQRSSIVTMASYQLPFDGDIKSSDNTTVEATPIFSSTEESQMSSPTINSGRFPRRNRPLSLSFKPSTFPKISETKELPSLPQTSALPPLPVKIIPSQQSQPFQQTPRSTHPPTTCTCGLPQPQPQPQPQIAPRPTYTYANASVQTDPLPSPPRTALRVDTAVDSMPGYSYTQETSPEPEYYSEPEYSAIANPYPMGSMLSFFSKPNYRLGDGLGFGMGYSDYDGDYIIEEEEEDYDDGLAAWIAANGRLD